MGALLGLILLLGAVIAGLVLFTARTARRVELLLPPVGKLIEVAGARLHVVEKGEGLPILLIHGLFGQMQHFTYGVVDELAKQFRVIVVDRPGAGYSVRLQGASASLSSQADVLAALLGTLHIDRPAVVVGHSLGGAVALALAQQHPQCVAGLALIAPLTHTPTNVSPAFSSLGVPQFVRVAFAWTLALPLAMRQRKERLALVFGPESVPADFAVRGGALLGVRPSHFVGACQDFAAAPQDLPAMASGYADLSMPVAVLFGKGDQILNPQEQGEALVAKAPNARLTMVDGGHMLPLTQPEVTTQFIQTFARTFQP